METLGGLLLSTLSNQLSQQPSQGDLNLKMCGSKAGRRGLVALQHLCEKTPPEKRMRLHDVVPDRLFMRSQTVSSELSQMDQRLPSGSQDTLPKLPN